MQALQHWSGPGLSDRSTLFARTAPDVLLNAIERSDPIECLCSNGRTFLVGVDVVELAPHVSPASSLNDVTALVYPAEAGVGISLQSSAEGLQVCNRPFALAVRRVLEPHCRWPVISGGSIISDVRPQPPGFRRSPARLQHRHRRVVGVQLCAREHVFAECSDQRVYEPRSAPKPVRPSRSVDFHALACVDLGLAIQRQGVSKLANRHVREQPWSRQGALDRPAGRPHLNNSLAATAAELGPHMPNHLEA